MDFSNASNKIADIVIKVNEYVDKINEIRNKYITKVNKCLDDLENTINDAIDKINAGAEGVVKWLQIKIEKITKNIQDILNNLKKKIQDIIDQLKIWYNNTINRIKANIIKSSLAKLGSDCTDDETMTFASLIPHPSIDSLLPNFEINLQLELPNMTGMVDIEKVNLPRL